MIEIKNLSGEVIFTSDAESLSGANITGANLSRANLYRANLSNADLRFTNLTDADLSGVDLRGADLSGADLSRADLYRANLYGANLYRANLSRADLYRANLHNVTGVNVIHGLKWDVLISHNIMKIGCQIYTHNEWKSFSDEDISKMHVEALEFWSKNKNMLIDMCENLMNENLSV